MNDSPHLAIAPDDIVHYMTHYRYGDNANGENGLFNCWGLLRDVQKRFFGIELPETSLGDPLAALYKERMTTGAWQIIDQPFHGAGVLMRDGLDPHCGVWLDFDGGGVLHCERGNGVLWQNKVQLHLYGYSNLKFYRFKHGHNRTH